MRMRKIGVDHNRECICDVTAMDIYDIRMERHEFDHSTLLCLENWL